MKNQYLRSVLIISLMFSFLYTLATILVVLCQFIFITLADRN